MTSGQYEKNTGRLPDWYESRPEIRSALQFYLSAFWVLTTERRYERGPIPWTAVRDFGVQAGLDPENIRVLHWVVAVLDDEYRAFSVEK